MFGFSTFWTFNYIFLLLFKGTVLSNPLFLFIYLDQWSYNVKLYKNVHNLNLDMLHFLRTRVIFPIKQYFGYVG
jgi:hypothetical protein